MTSANKRWTIFGRRWSMNADENSYLFLLIIFYHSFDHINNFIIICDRIKINCHHSFIRNPMMCVKDWKYITRSLGHIAVINHWIEDIQFMYTATILYLCIWYIPSSSNRIGEVIGRVLASSEIYCGFESQSSKTKDCKIGICCFSALHATLKSKLAIHKVHTSDLYS